MKHFVNKIIAFLTFILVFNVSAYSSPLEEEIINLPKVIYYLQVLSGMNPDIHISEKDTQFAIIGTSDVTGLYYPTGGAITKILKQADVPELSHIRFTVESTAGSASNIVGIMQDKISFGIVQSDVQYNAFWGLTDWENTGPQKELRSIFSIYSKTVNLIASDESGIDSIFDLKGKRVHIGHEGSGHRQNSIDILNAFGIDYIHDLILANGNSSAAPSMLNNDEIDAFFYTAGHPNEFLSSASETKPAHFVPISGEPVQKLIEEKPYYAVSKIPYNKYPGFSNIYDIETIGIKANLVTSSNTPDMIVYQFTKAIFSNLDDFIEMHPAYEGLTPETMLEGLTAPIHKGAELFYRENMLIMDIQRYVIGTGGITGVYYPTGGAITKLINNKSNQYGIQCSVESTDGSVYNVNHVLTGDLGFGVVQSDRQYQAFNGEAEWKSKGPQKNLRSIFSIHYESVTLIATEESGIQSIYDIKNKRINIGKPGSGPRQNSIDALEAAGINIDTEVFCFEETVDKAIAMLHNNEIDALFYTVGHPSSAILNATQGIKRVRIIPLSSPGIDEMIQDKTYYVKSVIPADLYPEILNTEDIETFGVKATFVTSVDISNDVIYAITKEVFDNFDTFKEMHPAYKYLTIEKALEGLSAPIHQGALRYYKENDMIKYNNLVIGTGSISGVYYPTGGAISKIVNQASDLNQIRLSVFSTDGSVYNINSVLNGGLDFGIVQSDRQYQAYEGLADWDNDPRKRIRSIFSIHNESVTLIAAEDANINSVSDLKGKKVNIGNFGSGQLKNSIDTLNAFNINYEEDIEPFYAHTSDAIKMIHKNEIDAFFYKVGHPSQAITQALSGSRGIKIVPISGDVINELIEDIPYYAKALIPRGTYGLSDDIESFGVKATFVTHDEMPDEIIYSICEQIFDNLGIFKNLHPAFEQLTPQSMLEGLSAPFHSGALSFYQDREMTDYKVYHIGTGSTSGVYYPTGCAISEIANKYSNEHIYLVSKSTPGSVYNINTVLSGDLSFGIVQSDRQYQAVHGISDWSERGVQNELRAIFSIHQESVALVALDNSGIESLDDLKGKKVNLGNHGSGQLQNSLDALYVANIQTEEITAFYEDAKTAADLLISGQIEAFFYTIGHPSSFIAEILNNEKRKVHLIPITGERLFVMLGEKMYYAKAIIKKDLYPEYQLTKDIETFGVKATFVTSINTPDQIVYDITRSIFEHFIEFKSLHPAYKNLTIQDMFDGNTAPYHSGAYQYFIENNFIE